MIDIDEMHIYRFGQLAIALYKGRLLGIVLSTGHHRDDVVALFPCDDVDCKGRTICNDKELHGLCASS